MNQASIREQRYAERASMTLAKWTRICIGLDLGYYI